MSQFFWSVYQTNLMCLRWFINIPGTGLLTFMYHPVHNCYHNISLFLDVVYVYPLTVCLLYLLSGSSMKTEIYI